MVNLRRLQSKQLATIQAVFGQVFSAELALVSFTDMWSQKAVQASTAPAGGTAFAATMKLPASARGITSNSVVLFVLEYRINPLAQSCTVGRDSDLTVFTTRERAMQ